MDGQCRPWTFHWPAKAEKRNANEKPGYVVERAVAVCLLFRRWPEGRPEGVQKGGGSSYQLTNADKYGDVLSLTFATDWPAIQCSAAIDGLKVGSGMGTGLAGVAKVSIRVPAKYDDRRATDFVIECSRY